MSSINSWQSQQEWYCVPAGLYKPILAVGRSVLCTCEEPVHISLTQGQGIQWWEGFSRQNIPGPCTRAYSTATDGSSAASFRMGLKADVGVLGRSQMQHRQLLDSFFPNPSVNHTFPDWLACPLTSSSHFCIDLLHQFSFLSRSCLQRCNEVSYFQIKSRTSRSNGSQIRPLPHW